MTDDRSMMPVPPQIVIIAAVARNGVIGADNTLPWRLSADLKRFKALTMGHPIIMGRNTFESLGRLLPGRTHIVLSRDPALAIAGAIAVASLDAAIAAGKTCEGGDRLFIIGGAEVYRQAIGLADVLQLTEIHRDFAGDAYFPAVDRRAWVEQSREHHHADEGFDFDFVTYARQGSA